MNTENGKANVSSASDIEWEDIASKNTNSNNSDKSKGESENVKSNKDDSDRSQQIVGNNGKKGQFKQTWVKANEDVRSIYQEIFEGKLILEVSSDGKKQKVTATTKDGIILHADSFSLLDAVKRLKFVDDLKVYYDAETTKFQFQTLNEE